MVMIFFLKSYRATALHSKNNNLDFKSRIMTSAALFVISARFSESFK